jgi:hypothetical protein
MAAEYVIAGVYTVQNPSISSTILYFSPFERRSNGSGKLAKDLCHPWCSAIAPHSAEFRGSISPRIIV